MTARAALVACGLLACAADGPAPRSGGDAHPAASVAPGSAGWTAGSSRSEAIEQAIAANRDGFRACFDAWSAKHPGEPGKVNLTLRLSPGGKVNDATAEPVGIDAPEMAACMVAHAKTFEYPPSFDGKETRHTHPFNFNAK
jgi:hypothetical protein